MFLIEARRDLWGLCVRLSAEQTSVLENQASLREFLRISYF